MGGERDVTVERARELARELAPATDLELVPVPESSGRVLAAAVAAARDLPAADVSAMDGWAVRAADTPGTLRAVGESAAGAPWERELAPGEAVAISTGGVLPPGADAVARREVTAVEDDRVTVEAPIEPGRDLRRRGELIRDGGPLLEAGHRIAPHEVGAIGAVGLARVPCLRRPTAAVLSTGAELVPLGDPAGPAQVYDSSRHGVAAQLAAAGAEVMAVATVGDDLDETVAALGAMLDAGIDVIVTCGGISSGPHDHVRTAFEVLCVEEVMRGVRATPIRPTWLGRRGGQAVLGLSGNPASAAVALHLLGRPLVGAPEDWWRRGPISVAVPGHPERVELVRCRERRGALVPAAHQGAHAVTSLTGADALAMVPPGGVAAGEVVAYSRMA
ncbi:MAG TPA: molybdopterin molybdotransferase MoeA [Miltoncostaea sp.]|nr:molybdopterin molybdotransferase MoeA [Miltoncostaea sp.]